MSFDSLREIEVETTAIAEDLAPVLVELQTVLGSGSASDGQLGRLDTALEAARDDTRTLRDAVGSVDVADYQIGSDAGDRLCLWGWQVDTVSKLRQLTDAALQSQAAVAQFRGGSQTTTHEVRAGETLQSIAAARLGDWREWHRLVDANDLDPAEVLAPGTVLVIPEKR